MADVPTNTSIGQPADRVEAFSKVTGSAKYASDYHFDRMGYGVVVTSSVDKGRILALDTSLAARAVGVITVLSHLNAPEVPGYMHNPMSAIPIFAGKEFKPLPIFAGKEFKP